jgi:hypothetical protein
MVYGSIAVSITSSLSPAPAAAKSATPTHPSAAHARAAHAAGAIRRIGTTLAILEVTLDGLRRARRRPFAGS